ncbi:MAG: ATP-binding protein [Thermodesulfovibrionales bacterium]|nr:ATP-binding protein [Thermodesulfovibrionales bacterium]
MEDLSLHILDIVENSITASAKNIEIIITDSIIDNRLYVEIKDDGTGMDEGILKRVEDPFYSTKAKKTGLGIPLLKQAAMECEGNFWISSSPGKGTSIKAEFRRDHIDRKPLGDIASTIVTAIISCPDCHFRLTVKVIEKSGEEKSFVFDTEELKGELEDIPINTPIILKFIKEHIRENLKPLIAY